MKARGNFTVDMKWRQSRLVQAVIRSDAGTPCKLRTATPVQVTHNGRTITLDTQNDGSVTFPTEVGESYLITPR
jgi:alpha-L-fucosidase 2